MVGSGSGQILMNGSSDTVVSDGGRVRLFYNTNDEVWEGTVVFEP